MKAPVRNNEFNFGSDAESGETQRPRETLLNYS